MPKDDKPKKEEEKQDLVSQENIDEILKLYFKQPKVLYEHLFASYHQLIEELIPYSLSQEKNAFSP